jgi:hypothetical protein
VDTRGTPSTNLADTPVLQSVLIPVVSETWWSVSSRCVRFAGTRHMIGTQVQMDIVSVDFLRRVTWLAVESDM